MSSPPTAARTARTAPPGARPAGPDLRLVGPAVAAWLAAALTAATGPRPALAVLLAVAALALLLRRAAARRSPAAAPRTSRRAPAALLLAALACAAAAVVASAARSATVRAGPLTTLARDRAVVTVDLTVTDDPRPLTGRVVGAQRMADLVVVTARAERVVAGDRALTLRRPVVLFAPPAGWSARLPGERLRVTGRLRTSLSSDAAATLEPYGAPLRLRRAPPAERLAGRLRRGLRDAAAVLPPDARGLLPGLVVGDTAGLDPRVREEFRATGLSHVVAVSGQNVAILLAAVLLLARRAGLGPRAAAVAGCLGLAFFVVLARPSPSVLRAATMGGLGLVATVTGRERAALRLLAGAVLFLVLLDPGLATSLGFALSTAATAGLLVLGPPWRARLARRLPGWLADAVATPLAAQVACAPLLAAAFGRLSLVAVPANVVAAPAVAPATVAGVVAAAIAPACLPLARAVAWLAGLPTGWLVRVARTFAALPAAGLDLPTGAYGALAACLLLGAAAFVLRRRAGRRIALAVAIPAVLAAAVAWQVSPGWPPPGWRLVACDVGQGDALVVRAGPATVVVDTGPDPIPIGRCLHDLGVRRLAAVVLTHFHADHVEGLPAVLRGRAVREVVAGPLDEPPDERARVAAWTAARRVPVRVAALGERWTAGDATLDVLGPQTAFHGTNSDPNNSSLVLRVAMPGVTLLLTGDVEEPAQLAVLARGPVGHADVLKVPHHGSARQTAEFLDATGAGAAIVSAGRDNPYGHPAPATLTALARRGMRTFRTDRDGDIAVTTAGGRVRVVGRHGHGRPPAAPPGPPVAPPTSDLAIAWRRAAEPGSWCPVRTRPSVPATRAAALTAPRTAQRNPTAATARAPPPAMASCAACPRRPPQRR
jgi:competence protein ComEC